MNDSADFFDETAERAWASARFYEYLLGKLDAGGSERMAEAVAVVPGLIDELDAEEERLIDHFLDDRLSPADRELFEAKYVHGDDEDHLAAFRLRQALRSPEMKQLLEPRKPVLVRPSAWAPLAIAASADAAVFAALYVHQSRQLDTAIAALKSFQRQPTEQPAGQTPGEAVTLAGTSAIHVQNPPTALRWNVPDYRVQYRMRIYAAGGDPVTSLLRTPRDNAISFAPDRPETRPLPWQIFILPAAGENVIAHFAIVRP